MIIIRHSAATLALVLGAACAGRPASDDSTRPADSASSRSAEAPRILGACCTTSDSVIIETIRRFESTTPAERPPELAFVHYRFNSGLDRRVQLVVRDSASWGPLWTEIGRTHSPKAPLPPVDFSRETLVIASMGTRSSGGYAIWVEGVSVVNDTLRISLREQSPGPTCGTPAVLTAPVALARIERSDLPVSFVSTPVTSHCT